jgi:hypothetical protein
MVEGSPSTRGPVSKPFNSLGITLTILENWERKQENKKTLLSALPEEFLQHPIPLQEELLHASNRVVFIYAAWKYNGYIIRHGYWYHGQGSRRPTMGISCGVFNLST